MIILFLHCYTSDSSAGGPGLNPQSRMCLSLNIKKGNTDSFSRIKTEQTCNG